MDESRARTADEIRGEFLDQCRGLVEYWAGPLSKEYSQRERLDGLLHSILTTIDGGSGGFQCALDLVCRPHPDDKEFDLSEGGDWIEDGTVLNEDVQLHELLARLTTR